jgi:hypothetical protein
MADQPFSAPRPRSLPTVSPNQPIEQTLANWQTQLQPLIRNVAPQPTPLNFTATNSRGGITLNWSPVNGGDGYEILKSASGSFADDLQVIPVKNVNQSTFFDSLGGNAQTAHYRIRTTSGTAANPQSQRGPESGVIRHTSIDASDTKSVPTTIADTFTTDQTRALARRGNYGAIRPTPLGKAGGSKVASGSKSVPGSPAGQPAQGATSFASIGTSTNNSATMIVSGAASIVPDPANPGTIDATELQGTEVSTAAPDDQQLLHYSAADGEWEPTSIIDLGGAGRELTLQVLRGTQANVSAAAPFALGEMYFAWDTGNLYFGTPGIGVGYIQIGDTTGVNETLQKLLNEIRALRLAMVSLACQGGQAEPSDFDPEQLAQDGQTAN